ncbi:hypothetical protein GK047_08165 [Paenibacillus sp. SYP-B3998]|uniref:Uncharacterized protein n=1 Tax=Paenibacillus sp. SYP-B3998 TaxID=2678564 RepID=A0A6G3ZWN1_9BACL|nr:hypothetical protein [Paenibacillus sp. SYP-B3998]NEW05981.1 hypothetical protein [Paenibacillus sp. SYP-B3998]
MNHVTEIYIKKHQQYVSENPQELKNYDTIYDHMIVYFTEILGMDEQDALRCIHDFKKDMTCDLTSIIIQSELL